MRKCLRIALAMVIVVLIGGANVVWAKCWQASFDDYTTVVCIAENGDSFRSVYMFETGSTFEVFCLSEDADGFDASLDGRQELQVWRVGKELETHTVDVHSNPTGVPRASPIAEVYSGESCGTLSIAGETTDHLAWDGMVFSLGGEVSDRINIDSDVLFTYLSDIPESPNLDNNSEAEPSPTSSDTSEIHLYGGPSESVYLGCYSCPNNDSDSICNEYGSYGSEYSLTSVWNEYGFTFGNQYSLSSPWNKYSLSADVPALVDGDGDFYGYFTINTYRVNAFSHASTLKNYYELYGDNLEKVRDAFCD